MGTGSKMTIGIALLILGIFLILPGGGNLGDEAWNLIKGSVPLVILLFGALIIWIEWEEMKGPPKPPTKRKK